MINHRPITHQRGVFGYKRYAKNVETGKTKDSHEWRCLKGMMRRNLPYRQEGVYELEDTALVAKREQELPLEVISSIGA
ncbi:hypothetical protein ES703_36437 [subsurface metagenome]